MNAIIKQYCVLVEFLGKALGPDYEVVLHDLTTPEHRIAAIVNNHISGRSTGAPLTNLALQFLADKTYEACDYKVNYRGMSSKNSKLRSSTMFIKDGSGEPIGMLCINFDTDKYFNIMENLSSLCQIPFPDCASIRSAEENERPVTAEGIETFAESMPEVIRSTLTDALKDASIPPERLTQSEKLTIVDALNQKGVFLLKGAVSEVARQLSSSDATIYRYLSKLNKK